jgi:serine/threonine protein phosphatase PrpC
MQVHLTSLPTSDLLSPHAERLAFFAMVADGVGGSAGGAEASRLAVAAITRYVTQAMHCYYAVDLADEERFPRALEAAALRVHLEIQASSPTGPLQAYMATTSAKQACEDLLRDALDAGGTDNVTVLVGRTLRKDAT